MTRATSTSTTLAQTTSAQTNATQTTAIQTNVSKTPQPAETNASAGVEGGLETQAKDETAPSHEDRGQPVDIAGAYVGGYLYYPYRFKRTVVEDGVELSRYETRVLRSDGVSLGYGYKPAPKGTPQEDRVLALDDGTDITRVPVASTTRQSFSLAGMACQSLNPMDDTTSKLFGTSGTFFAKVKLYQTCFL